MVKSPDAKDIRRRIVDICLDWAFVPNSVGSLKAALDAELVASLSGIPDAVAVTRLWWRWGCYRGNCADLDIYPCGIYNVRVFNVEGRP